MALAYSNAECCFHLIPIDFLDTFIRIQTVERDLRFIFEWDERKAKGNVKKHKIDFLEARTVFNDPFSITIHDYQHSNNEKRFVDIGCSVKGHILVVAYTERGKTIRIISSRKATKSERRMYEEKR